MLKGSLYGLLESPFWYRLSQTIFAPGADSLLVQKLEQTLSRLPSASGPLLDIGCGPSSWLSKIGLNPVGLDICHQYSVAYHHSGGVAMTGSAMSLPIDDQTFDAVWSIGVLHHLPDSAARLAVQEMMRVCRPGGSIAVLDAVMPIASWRRPLAYMVRLLDRGEFMRSQSAFEKLLPSRTEWVVNRFTYAFNGLEMVMCLYHKPEEQRI